MRKLTKAFALIASVFTLASCDLGLFGGEKNNSNTKVEQRLAADDDNTYYATDCFDDYVCNGGLEPYIVYTDGSEKNLSKNEFTYVVTNEASKTIDPNAPFGTDGNFKVKLTKSTLTYTYSISVLTGGRPGDMTLSSIKAEGYSKNVRLNKPYKFDGAVIATYRSGDTKDVTNKCTIGTIDTSTIGNKTLTISYQEESIKKTISVTISVVANATPEGDKSAEVTTFNSLSFKLDDYISFEAYQNTATTSPVILSDGTCRIYQSGGAFDVISSNKAVITDLIFTSIDNDTEINYKAKNDDDILEEKNISITANEEITISKIGANTVTIVNEGVTRNNRLNLTNLKVKYYIDEGGGSSITTVVTGVSVNPVVKTISVGDTFSITADVKPNNASNKEVTWSTSKPSIASVDNNGLVKGLAVGTATIICTTVDQGLTASCALTVTKNEQISVDGDAYIVRFEKHDNDSSTSLTTDGVFSEISSGEDYVDSIIATDRVYSGKNGLKFSSSTRNGTLSIKFDSKFDSLVCKQIQLETAKYGSDAATISLTINEENEFSESVINGSLAYTPEKGLTIQNISLKASKRMYLTSITFVCEALIPVPVTAISLPSTATVSVGNSANISVSYTPDNANSGKEVTWTSSNTLVASVNNGNVTGISAGTSTITAKTKSGLTASCLVTVKNVLVESVSLSETEVELTLNGTKQLTATISPSNATNKEVTWSSSNSTVASVNANGVITAGSTTGTAVITVATKDGNKTATCAVTVLAEKLDAWTIMIYMCGNDLESDSGLASGDINEILSVSNQPDDVNIIIETGGAKRWNTSGVKTTELSRFHVANKKLVKEKESPSKANMGLSSTFQSFLEWGLTEYPAEKTGVIMWNHGGAMYGVCYDENYSDDSLLNSEVNTAVAGAFNKLGRSSKLEFIGYDACLMAVQDIAEFNSKYFNYMVCSEESEAGYGWDYDNWIDDLYAKKSTSTILKAVVDSFIKDNGGVDAEGEYYQGYYYSADQTLSYLNLSFMSEYKTAFDAYTDALSSKLNESGVNKSNFSTFIKNNVKYFAGSDYTYFSTFDIGDFVNNVKTKYSFDNSYTSNLLTAYGKLVEYSSSQKEGAKDATGLALVFHPVTNDTYYIKQAYNSSETNFSKWLTFAKNFSYMS